MATIWNFVERYISRRNYFCRTAEFGDTAEEVEDFQYSGFDLEL